MKHLTTIENIKNSNRFVSNKIDDVRIEPYIDESQQMDIKPVIGDALFIDLINYVNAEDKTGFPDYSVLLGGGEYMSDICGNRGKRMFKGLVESLNYYVWARIVKNNNFTVTRFGIVNKTDQYSANAELKERLVLEKDALAIADRYLRECIDYLNANRDKFPLFNRARIKNRLNISIIGI